MKRLILALMSTLFLAGSAGAMERYNMADMTCSQIKAALKEQGTAILRSKSKRVPGMMTYNLYVGGRHMCPGGQAPTNRRINVADGSCTVVQCVTPSHSWMRP